MTPVDADLHFEDGTHRTTAPTADGHVLELHERRILRHLDAHRQQVRPDEADPEAHWQEEE